jgi:multidrug resistance efflux pump
MATDLRTNEIQMGESMNADMRDDHITAAWYRCPTHGMYAVNTLTNCLRCAPKSDDARITELERELIAAKAKLARYEAAGRDDGLISVLRHRAKIKRMTNANKDINLYDQVADAIAAKSARIAELEAQADTLRAAKDAGTLSRRKHSNTVRLLQNKQAELEQRIASIEAETIERCAKVCDENAKVLWTKDGVDTYLHPQQFGDCVRALAQKGEWT